MTAPAVMPVIALGHAGCHGLGSGDEGRPGMHALAGSRRHESVTIALENSQAIVPLMPARRCRAQSGRMGDDIDISAPADRMGETLIREIDVADGWPTSTVRRIRVGGVPERARDIRRPAGATRGDTR